MNVYVIASEGGMCKVGIAGDPKTRMVALSTGHPFALAVAESFEVGDGARARRVEAKAHDTLASCRLKGEWFSVEPFEAVAAVKQAIRELGPILPPQRCGSCRFWLLAMPDEEPEAGKCRRHTPGLDPEGRGAWPLVTALDWCGEWELGDIDAEDDI